MFFRHVVGKVQLYPYVHIVTWGLPKRYLGLLRIFNLPLEEFPHQYLTQYPEKFNSYEHQITKKSISPLQPNILTDDLAKPRNNTTEEKFEDEVHIDDFALVSKKRRRSRKKSLISIRVKLDDELKNLKRTNGKNFDKILSKCSRRSCFLVLEKCDSSKRDEYSLNFVNNTGYSKSYSKLLRKNLKKTKHSIGNSTNVNYAKPQKTLCSEFSEESIYPKLKRNENYLSETKINSGPTSNKLSQPNSNEPYNFSKKVESKEELDNNNQKRNMKMNTEDNLTNKNSQLAIPNHLIPYESLEKPLRNWPVITQLFDKDHIKTYKNYLESLSSKKEEEDEIQEIQEKDEIVSIDITEAKNFHESLKSSKLLKNFNETELSKKQTTVDKKNTPTTISRSSESSELPVNKETFAMFEKDSSTKNFDKLNRDFSETQFFIEKPIISSNYFIGSEKSTAGNGLQKLYTSRAYLLIGETDEESKNENKTKNFSDSKNVIKSSQSDSKANIRLLSRSMKTYESITSSAEEKTIYNIEEGYHEEDMSHNSLERSKIKSEKKIRGMKKLYIFNIVLALFVTVVLIIILFISFADASTINKVVGRYIRVY
ncbi:uncharacterized protein LOC123688756 isoform X2 [Harmonia axyridis]|uniref:uncharacterized protein LOC123688756 isoform X2 n=1 Tax=Harmonia axyridis TaxID=115357 RepID=UPI001E274EFD|nr:uncharacterized protein LOC123688756 isoform X2 [Harmonia axyridis]